MSERFRTMEAAQDKQAEAGLINAYVTKIQGRKELETFFTLGSFVGITIAAALSAHGLYKGVKEGSYGLQAAGFAGVLIPWSISAFKTTELLQRIWMERFTHPTVE